MRVLVIRPRDDALRTAQALLELNHEPLVAPLFEIRLFEGPAIRLDEFQAVLVTSANGVRALAKRTVSRDVRVFAVGTHTSESAQSEGFRRVIDADGDAEALSRVVRSQLNASAGPLLHAAGMNASGKLADELTRAGFDIRNSTLYETIEKSCLPRPAADALREHALDAVLVFSPRSGQIFADRVREDGLKDTCCDLVACCISDSAAHALAGLHFKDVRVAKRPDQASLLALLNE